MPLARRAGFASIVLLVAFAPWIGAQQRQDFPARPPGDPAAIARGKVLYGANCAFCHGADTRGGDGGPSLLRAATVLDDRNGELIAPIVSAGRTDRGMPKFSFSDEQIRDVAAFVHSFTAAGYDASRMTPPTILVGDAKAGEVYFARTCASCHSVSGDLRGIASRVVDPKLLQQTWLMPGSGGRAAAALPLRLPPPSATVTLDSGDRVEGILEHLDDFSVSLTLPDGTHRSFRIVGGAPKVEVRDPLRPHKDLLRKYTDDDIHNITAYLATLK